MKGARSVPQPPSYTENTIYGISPDPPFIIRNLRLHFLSAGEKQELPVPPELHL